MEKPLKVKEIFRIVIENSLKVYMFTRRISPTDGSEIYNVKGNFSKFYEWKSLIGKKHQWKIRTRDFYRIVSSMEI